MATGTDGDLGHLLKTNQLDSLLFWVPLPE
jgi:hypothetical protein